MKTKEKKSGWGGKRAGAGGKQTNFFETKTMRVPVFYEDVIRDLIHQLHKNKSVCDNDAPVETEPCYLYSLQNKKQEISFRIAPLSKPNA